MDKYLAKSQSNRSHRLQSQPSGSLTSLRSTAPNMAKSTPRNKKDKPSAKPAVDPNLADLEEHATPELLSRDDITPPNLSPCYSPETLPETEGINATSVAQEVSRLLMPLFDKRLDVLHTSINSALSLITTNAQKISELKNRVTACEIATNTLDQTCSQHQETERALRDKIEDLENRSRRNNLRFVGIPENITGDDLLTFLTTDMLQALGIDLPPDLRSIERVHRIGPPNPPGEGNRRPRPVIARYLNWSGKERILQAYRRQNDLQVRDRKLLIFQDFSASVSQKRRAFTPICRYLHNKAIRFQLLYPAKLKIQNEGRQLFFEDPTQARRHFNITDDDHPIQR